MQKACHAQSFTVQERKRFACETGQASLRHEAAGIRRADQAYLQEESEDYQESHPQT